MHTTVVVQEIQMEMTQATQVVGLRTSLLQTEHWLHFLVTKMLSLWSQEVVVVPQVVLASVNIKEMGVSVVAYQACQVHAVEMIVTTVLLDQVVRKTEEETHNHLQSLQDLV
jgi:hypothetical protein